MANLILTMLISKLNVSCFVQGDYTAEAVRLVKKVRLKYMLFLRDTLTIAMQLGCTERIEGHVLCLPQMRKLESSAHTRTRGFRTRTLSVRRRDVITRVNSPGRHSQCSCNYQNFQVHEAEILRTVFLLKIT